LIGWESFADTSRLATIGNATRSALVIDDAIDVYTEGRSRLTNLLDGMGLAFDIAQQDQLDGVDKDRYQLLIVAPTSDREFKLSEKAEQQIIAALGRGTNVLWIGGGIWGTFRTTHLPDAFGLKYISQGWSSDVGAATASFRNLAGQAEHLTLYKEMIYSIEAAKAQVDGWYLDSTGRQLALPFLTRHQAAPESGQAVYLSMPLLNFWKSAENSDTYARAEVLFKTIRKLTGRGTVGKHPAPDAREGVFILRLEDYTPGGAQMAHTGRMWLIRMQRLLELAARHQVPVNIALIPKYADPYRGEFHNWSDSDPAILTLRTLAARAFKDGGSLIVHGYTHQHGDGPGNFSGDDWEVWDEAHKRYLPADEQKKIAADAMNEIIRQWNIRPSIWETPHYAGNEDTTRAIRDAGFKYMTESDTKLFPNRDGYLNRAQGLLLNIPETAFNVPKDPDEIRTSGLNRQHALLPALVRMNGLFYVFYHNMSTHQERALENLFSAAQSFDLWKPGLEQYAEFWERRQKATVESTIDSAKRWITARVENGFAGLTLSIRLPDGAMPGELTIDGKPTALNARQADGVWYALPVLTAAGRSEVVLIWRNATSPGESK
jgi:hypothetical protein